MKISRRELLATTLAGGAVIASSGCSRIVSEGSKAIRKVDFSVPTHLAPEDVRILNRVGYGRSLATSNMVEEVGADRWIQMQLDQTSPEPIDLKVKLERIEIFAFEPDDLRDWPEEEVLRQLQQAAILRAVYSPNQLRERMVDFWTNHFNIYGRKGFAMYRLGKDSTNVVRKHALGNFREMLEASAKSPAMLGYLDNQFNRKGVVNENHAREILELHTLGVNAGYSIEDVQEVARCFTGWTIEKRFMMRRGQYRFDSDSHDYGEKVVLGKRIAAGGGESDGIAVIDLLAQHPATAKRLSRKLGEFFCGAIDSSVEEQAANAYIKSGGEIKEILRIILRSRHLKDGPPFVKRPLDFVVSALRAVGAETDGGAGLQNHLDKMGQPLYQWPMPDGYPSHTAAWSSSLLARWNFAIDLCANEIKGTNIAQEKLREAASAASIVHGTNASSGGVSAQDFAIEICSPEFQWR